MSPWAWRYRASDDAKHPRDFLAISDSYAAKHDTYEDGRKLTIVTWGES